MSISDARGSRTTAKAGAAGTGSPRSVGVVRAGQELSLRRGEFELAVQLGLIRTTVVAGSGRRQVAGDEIDRLRAAEGFPDALRERVRTVGTAEGALLMSVGPGRFTRLARAGYVTPVRFYLNRYRAIVWLYLAEELRAFAVAEPDVLAGRLPRVGGPAGEEDRRPRNWRGRRVGQILQASGDPWERAAVIGSVLDAGQLAEAVRDPYERAYLNRLAPALVPGRAESEAARTTIRRLAVADGPDEIRWHRAGLGALLEEARRVRPAPRPGPVPVPVGGCAPGPGPEYQAADAPMVRSSGPPRERGRSGLLTWLRGGRTGRDGTGPPQRRGRSLPGPGRGSG